MGCEFTHEVFYNIPSADNWINEAKYRLELYRDEEDGNFYMRIMKDSLMIVLPQHLNKKVAVLLEER
jgi:hypothetical protein